MPTNFIDEVHINMILNILSDEYQEGKDIIHVYFDSNFLEELILQKLPCASLLNIDFSSILIKNLTEERLNKYKPKQISAKKNTSKIPKFISFNKTYQVIVSAQTNCNILYFPSKHTLNLVHKLLERNGLFLVLAQFAVPSLYCLSCYINIQKRQGESYSALVNKREYFEAYAKQINTKRIRSVQLEPYLSRLCEAGFKLACLHLYGNYALIGARRI